MNYNRSNMQRESPQARRRPEDQDKNLIEELKQRENSLHAIFLSVRETVHYMPVGVDPHFEGRRDLRQRCLSHRVQPSTYTDPATTVLILCDTLTFLGIYVLDAPAATSPVDVGLSGSCFRRVTAPRPADERVLVHVPRVQLFRILPFDVWQADYPRAQSRTCSSKGHADP